MMASVNLVGIDESATLAMTRRAAELDRADDPVLSLSAGEPDFATPEFIAEAGIRAIRDGHTHYPPAAGLKPLREAVASYVGESCGGCFTADQVIVSVGAKQAIFDAVFSLFGPGDALVVPAPYWVSYPPIARLSRCEPWILNTTAESGFKPDPDALDAMFRDGARGVVLNSPSNPTGAMLDAGEVATIVAVAERHGAWILSDEIYHAITYEKPFASVAPHCDDYDRIVLVNGFSKAFAMTGWRVGYAIAPVTLVKQMTSLQGHVNTNTALPAQYAALAALTEGEERESAIAGMVAAFARRRRLLLTGLEDVSGMSAQAPDGAFYLWADVRPWCARSGLDSAALCLDLLEHERVALVPGSAFGAEEYVRLSFATSEDVLSRATDRLAEAARRLDG